MIDPQYALFPAMEDTDFYECPDLEAEWLADAQWEEDEFDPVTGLPLIECSVCGVRAYIEGMRGQVCSVCGWQQDDSLQDEWEESTPNGGLSLVEAQLNFRTFGEIEPARLREGDREDAEF